MTIAVIFSRMPSGYRIFRYKVLEVCISDGKKVTNWLTIFLASVISIKNIRDNSMKSAPNDFHSRVAIYKKKTSFDNVSLSDKYALLLDDSLKENQALREQLKERDEGNAAKFQDPQTRKRNRRKATQSSTYPQGVG